MKKRVVISLCLLLALATLAESFCVHYSFEDASAAIKDSIGKCDGQYTPAASRDNDTPETTNPERYHKHGVVGKALYFFPLFQSYAEMLNFKMPETETLYIRFYFRLESHSRQYIIGNRHDVGKQGFSVFNVGGKWMVDFADGTSVERVTVASNVPLRNWGLFEVQFNKGEWSIHENGELLKSGTVGIKRIAEVAHVITFGNYPLVKHAYPMNGALDELVLASSADVAPKPDANTKIVKCTINALVEPVEGNERHFGGIKTLHAFEGMPVDAKFMLYIMKGAQPRLRITFPKGVDFEELPTDETRTLLSRKELSDGRLEYLFAFEIDPEKAKQRKIMQCLINLPDGFTEGNVTWAALDGEQVMYDDDFVLKVIPPLPVMPEGRFYYMSWLSAFNYSEKNMRRFAELFKRVGLTGKGLFPNASTDEELLKKDAILKNEYGFKLFSVDLWDGPTRASKWERLFDGVIPRAVNKEGKADENRLCDRQMVDSPRAYELYKSVVAKRLHPELVSVAMMDYEPWSAPANFCFCDYCLGEFRKENNLDHTPTADEILKDYRPQWAAFWTETCERWTEMMVRAFKEVGPNVEVWDYTYVFPYNDEKALNDRFFSIPKDVRRNEKYYDCSMLSLYHVNGRAAYEQTLLSSQHLKKPICQASLISRSNLNSGNYTSPSECLSPEQIFQKAILFGAMGHTCYSIWPGLSIEATALTAMARAARIIRTYERFYLDGKLVDKLSFIVDAKPEQYLTFVHEKDGKLLATMLNFTSKPMIFDVERLGKVTVAPNSAEVREVP